MKVSFIHSQADVRDRERLAQRQYGGARVASKAKNEFNFSFFFVAHFTLCTDDDDRLLV